MSKEELLKYLIAEDEVVYLLNQQDKRIKELETCLDEEIESNVNLYNLRSKTEQENQQLKQQLAQKDKEQNQKAIELLQELLEKTKTLNLMIKSDHYVNQKQVKVVFEDVIIQKISELKGKVEDD